MPVLGLADSVTPSLAAAVSGSRFRAQAPRAHFLPCRTPRTMDRVFTEVAATFKTVVSLTHQQRVTRLYRRSLRELNSWVIDRELFCEEAEKIRAQFNENRALDPHSGLSQRLIREAESKVFSFTHPDPYVKPYMPGGSKFMRNPPIPLKVRPA